ncbi:MAG: peptidase M23 family protein [Candidatus Magasanikbacteria bacterium]|nr:peptidase M23 family protein [Candidatus Magasanikbacteria bacterium]
MLKTAYKIFLKLLTLLVYVKRFIVFVLRFIGRIFLRTGELLLPVAVLPVYRAALKLRRASEQAPGEHGIIFWLTNPVILAVIGIVLMISGVVFENIVQAKATLTSEQNNLVFDLVPTEEGITEEASVISVPVPPPSSYSSVIGVPVGTAPEEEIELVGEEGVSGVINAPLIAPGAVSDRREIIKYAVQSGDTIYGIAAKFDVTVSTILQENGLKLTSILRPGDTLTVLPVSGISYAVKKGDTLAKIAKNFSADPERIVEFNRLSDQKDIVIGEKLVIPGGIAPTLPSPIRPAPPPVGFRNIAAPPSSAQARAAGFIWPTTGRVITQYFRGRRHTGIDIDGDYSSPIYATIDGVVEFAGWNKGGYGLMILIDHGNGIKSRYAHNSRLFAQKGDYVSKGQTIAMVGTTGRSTGTHLHFEIIENGKYVNPFKYVR